MAYDGLTFTYSTGQKAGMPEDQYLEFKKNELLFFQYNKPIPYWVNEVNEPDGSTVAYRFAYSNPFSYYSKDIMTLPTVTPEGVLIDSGIMPTYIPFEFSVYTPTATYTPMDIPIDGPAPSTTTYTPAVTTPYTPATNNYQPVVSGDDTSLQSSWGDLVPLVLAGIIGIGYHAKSKAKKRETGKRK